MSKKKNKKNPNFYKILFQNNIEGQANIEDPKVPVPICMSQNKRQPKCNHKAPVINTLKTI